MKILLTFDYELYFGPETGTFNNCLIKPTELIRSATESLQTPTTQFVDAGYLLRLKAEGNQFPECAEAYHVICSQLKAMVAAGHEIQLHVHPHWEDCRYDGRKWMLNTDRYRIHKFDEADIERIFHEYFRELQDIAGNQTITTYRAGGWCVQPFNAIRSSLLKLGIRTDSSVFPGGHYTSDHYYYDFRNCPDKSSWKFEADPTKEHPQGSFTEIPISSIRNSPLFYWKLFLLGRLFPDYHKPIGDGRAIAAPGQRKKLLTQTTLQTVSLDGYNAALLNKALQQHQKKNAEFLVIIGHPKSLTPYGADALRRFIETQRHTHHFTTFNHLRHT